MKRLTGLAMVVFALALIGNADASTSGLHRCGDKPDKFAYGIKADFACRKAKKIVNGWFNGVTHGGSPDRNVKGFSCHYKQTGYEVAKVRCKTKHRKVRWTTGS